MACVRAVRRQWWYCATHIQEANWVSVGICVASLCILAVCKVLNKRYVQYPSPSST